jgi:hypothetical protein
MLTIFGVPKAFQGHIGIIQRNAIRSWLALRLRCQVILLGDEDGTAEVARTFNVTDIPAVARNEYGTPLLNDVIQKVESLASHDLMCYVNCDVILGRDLLPGIDEVRRVKNRFLIIGQCWNLNVDEALSFGDPHWEDDLRQRVEVRGTLRNPRSKDYFVFPRGLYPNLPPFALGRAYFDCWLVWKALKAQAAIVDATPVVVAVHQNHTYSHLAGGFSESLYGKEAQRNLELAGGRAHGRHIYDANYRLTQKGLKWHARGWLRVGHLLHLLRTYRQMEWKDWWWLVLENTRPLRHAIGFNLHNFQRVKSYLTRG